MKSNNILIVDDDQNIQHMLRVCLTSHGYEVETCSNGREALERVVKNRPRLALLDLAMPVLDGMSVLAELQGIARETAPRVIVITAHGTVRTAIAAIRMGASDFLEKPFTPEDVRLSVASVLAETPLGRPSMAPAPEEPGYTKVLGLVRDALREGRFSSAEALLMRAGSITDSDPSFLNLAGVLHEAHGRRASARRFYEKARSLDGGFEPARQNLRRLFEVERYGHSADEVALGDEQELLSGFRGRIGPSQVNQLRRLAKDVE